MAITFLPSEFLAKAAPERAIKKLVTNKLTLNRAALSMLTRSGVLTKKTLTEVALKVVKDYKKRYAVERADGASKAEALDETLNGKKQMVQRVQNSVVNEVANEIKSQYEGELYTWLPSDADTPDPLHQLNYGLVFTVGVGEMPGDRYGCRCGMEIHTKDTELEL